MRDYVLKVKRGSADEIRIKQYLKNADISYEENNGVFDDTIYIRFHTDKATWKRIKKNFGLVIFTSYCTFKELLNED